MSWSRLNIWLLRSAIALLAIVCVFVVVQLLAGLATSDPSETAKPRKLSDAPVETAAADTEDAPRAIAPARFATPFAQNAIHLERIAPREPLTPTVARETGPRPTLLHKPLVIAAGELAFQEGGLRLKGVIVTEPDETCTAPDGTLWPCGIIARTAFRNFISGRSLSCILPDDRWEETIVVSCLVGRQDPAAWLASRGWARTFFGSKYEELESEAIKQGLGLHGTDPRGVAAIPDSNTLIEPDGINPGSDPLPVPLR